MVPELGAIPNPKVTAWRKHNMRFVNAMEQDVVWVVFEAEVVLETE